LRLKLIFLKLIFLFLSSYAYSVPLENLVTPSQAAQLKSSGEFIMEVQLRNPAPKLLPRNNELNQFVGAAVNGLKPAIMVETLYLYKKPENFHTSANAWGNDSKIKILNQVLALSSLTGTQYFSASRNAMRTFYEYSGVIDGQQTKNPLPDPVYRHLPDTVSLFARQKDLTFGDNIYSYNYVISGDVIFFTQENLTSMNYGIVPVIGKNNLRSVLAVIDCGDSILIYTVSMAKAFSVPGMADRISSSFSNRAEAVLKWFTGRLDKEIFSQL